MTKSKKIYFVYAFLSILPIILYLVALRGTEVKLGQNIFILLSYIPYMGLFLLAFLGLRLNQTRITFIALILLGCYHWLHNPNFLVGLGIGRIRLGQIIALGIPLTCIAIFSFRESYIRSLRFWGRVLMALLPFAFFIAFFTLQPGPFHQMTSWNFLYDHTHSKLPLVAVLLGLIYLLFAIFLKTKHLKQFLHALFYAQILVFYSAHILMTPSISGHQLTFNIVIPFTLLNIILLHTIFKMYWSKVYIDELTEIPNRRALDEHLMGLSGQYTLGMIDIDHFKKFNDTYGHEEGDNVLRYVAAHIFNESKARAYRYGGEEFTLIFKGINKDDAIACADQIRQKLAQRSFYIRAAKQVRAKTSAKNRGTQTASKKVQVTISIGLASAKDKSTPATDVIKMADKALYMAKEAGRNQVKIIS